MITSTSILSATINLTLNVVFTNLTVSHTDSPSESGLPFPSLSRGSMESKSTSVSHRGSIAPHLMIFNHAPVSSTKHIAFILSGHNTTNPYYMYCT